MRYSTSLYVIIGAYFVKASLKDFLKVPSSKLVLEVLTRQSIQHDHIFFFKTKGSIDFCKRTK